VTVHDLLLQSAMDVELIVWGETGEGTNKRHGEPGLRNSRGLQVNDPGRWKAAIQR